MATSSEQTVNATGAFAFVNGIDMYYEIQGAGDPLVLIHGGGSTIETTFRTIMPMLARTHTVIAVELQAHGHTSDRDAPESFTQDANDVAELLRILEIDRADIFGFSNGGQTAMELAMRHPDRVRKLVIASAFYRRNAIPDVFWSGFEAPNFGDMPQIYKEEFAKINDDPAALMNMFRKDVERMKSFVGWSEDDLRSITSPALIALGDRDICSPEHAVEMSRLIPNARLCILPGDHGSYLGEAMSWGSKSKVPELFCALVEEFLAST